METTVVNVKVKYLKPRKIDTFVQWSNDPNHIYIGRHNMYVKAPQSKWHNPFTVKKYGLEKALSLYEKRIRDNRELMDSLCELKGKELGCWCKPEKCHGDVLVKLIKENCIPESKINEIRFYDTKDEFGFCSNFYPHPITVDGEVWINSESAFQAMKFRGKNANKRSRDYSKLIHIADSPMKVKMLGTQKKNTFYGKKWVLSKKEDQRLVNDLIDEYKNVKMDPEWETRKLLVMIHILAVKFMDKTLQKKLTSVPDNSYFIEHTKRDKIWGDGGDGTGKNYLGKILTCLCHHFKGKKMSKELRKLVKINF